VRDSELNCSKYYPNLICASFLHECNLHLLLSVHILELICIFYFVVCILIFHACVYAYGIYVCLYVCM
jgi:hypothetical protein